MDKSSKKHNHNKFGDTDKNNKMRNVQNGFHESGSDSEIYEDVQRDVNRSYKNHRGPPAKPETEDEEEAEEVIEIDSEDSRDGYRNNNNEESSPDRQRAYEQNNNNESERESTSSDVVIVSDDFQRFYEDIEQSSKIVSTVQLNPEDKVNKNDFKILKLLGTGAYGKVFLVEKIGGVDNGQLYAMKVLEKSKVTLKKKTTEHTRTEREVLEKVIDCPFLATLFYAFQTPEKLYLVMEFVQGGELFSHLYKTENFAESQVRFYIAEIIVALEQLHEYNIIYRDIKLENILLDKEGHIIITDFGLSKELKDGARAYSYCGTIEYMAPEIVNPNCGHDLNVDWWSVGVLIIELLTGQSPFSREGEESNQQVISERIQNSPPTIPEIIGPEAKDLILKLLEKDPRKRLGSKKGAQEIKNHPFFRKIKWNVLKNKQYEALMVPTLKDRYDVSQFSEDFTNQKAIDGPAENGPPVGPRATRYFRGYSFVAPHLRKSVYMLDLNIASKPEMNQPTLEDVYSMQRRSKSPFFKKYRIQEDSELLGDGTYSLCVKCFSIEDGQEYAVKIVKLDHDSSQEFEALEMCQGHKNVVKLIEKISDKKFTYIVCELLDGGELFNRIRHNGYLSETLARLYFKQIVDVVSFMHSKSIVHRDLKPENFVFVNDDPESDLKLLDFGFACHETTDETPPCFTLDYAAPESLIRSPTKSSRDLWALGVILYTMLCGNTPFKPTNKDQDERNYRMQYTENIRRAFYNISNERWSHISRQVKDLIASLLVVNESNRLTLKELKDHPWMNPVEKFKPSEKDPTKIFHRAESEDTVINDDIDDDDYNDDYNNVTVKINNDDEITQLPENREETRSNDDSSSGIVMSERNEGSSSVSSHHEELDENVVQVFDEYKPTEKEEKVMQENHNEFIAVQEEPENLSMKEEVMPENSEVDNENKEMPIDTNESSESIKKSKSIKRTIPKHRKKKITKKKTDCETETGMEKVIVTTASIDDNKSAGNKVENKEEEIKIQKLEESPLPRHISGDIEEKFTGYDDNLVDGYPNIGFMDQKEDVTLILFGNLFSKCNEKSLQENPKVLQVIKPPNKRGRRKLSGPSVKSVQSTTKNNARLLSAKTEPAKKRGRKPKDDINCVIQTQTLVDINTSNNESDRRTRLRRKCADDKVIRYDQVIINVESYPQQKRARKKTAENVKPMIAVIKEEAVLPTKRGRKRKNEGMTEQKRSPQKRRKIQENKIINIKAEKNPRPNINEYTIPTYPSYAIQTPQFTRRPFIKTESIFTPSVVIHHQDQNYSGRSYNISEYVDNKNRHSMIQCTIKTPISCGIKNEKFEKSPIKQYGVIPSRRMPRKH
ncbi:unnamed protein product [Chironomus riparius]|uniref:non-specific serine/threonine protein kinase n=1 Tax=Chironomus riparius TaxID=315576 RepID=A0A9N9RMH0_9DIPT|nr:unnamed protein product [Chironomus riparius]